MILFPGTDAHIVILFLLGILGSIISGIFNPAAGAMIPHVVKENQLQQGLCGSDYVKLQELHDRQTELEAQLEEKTERWFYLNDLKERIDAQYS